MNTQYRKNLKGAMTACKNYTDQKAEEILWQLAENDVSTSDDNTTASTKTVPSNATRCKIKRIYGLTQKFNPSVASDSTSAMVKTMPSTVYDFDVSKVEGKSEKSENLIVLSDVAQTTTSYGITYKVENGAVSLSGTNNDSSQKAIALDINFTAKGASIYKIFVSGTATTSAYAYITTGDGVGNQGKDYTNTSYGSFNNTYTYTRFIIYIPSGQTFTNYIIKPMVVEGSTEPTTFVKGYDGIHNLELSGLKVEGANLFSIATTSNSNFEYNADTCYFKLLKSAQYIALPTDITLEAGTYTVYRSSSANQLYLYELSTNNVVTAMNGTTSATFTLTKTTTIHAFASWNGLWEGNLAIARGSSALTTYPKYVSPTTKTIDLSTILYNGSPLFEDNSLKKVSTSVDYLTPYKARKEALQIVLDGSDDESWQLSSSTDNRFIIQNFWNTYGVAYDNGCVNNWEYSYQSSLTNNTRYICRNGGQFIINYDSNSILTLDQWKAYLQNNPLIVIFPLAAPIEVSIDWSSTLRHITGYSNGTITLLNTNNQDTDNTITYNSMIKENCCAKIVQSRGGNVVKTINLPTTASDGYSAGSQYNYRDLTTSKRIGNVSVMNMGTAGWAWTDNAQYSRFYIFLNTIAKYPSDLNTLGNVLTKNYTNNIWSDFVEGIDKTMSLRNDGAFAIRDLLYSGVTTTDLNIFKTAMANEPLYYELADASKTETSIDSVDNVIEVEPNDVLSFYDENDNPVTVPSDLTYRIEVAE